VLVVYAGCSLVACFSILQSTVKSNRISGIIVILFCAVAWLGIQYLGYAEFSVAGKMLFSGDFQKNLKVQLELHSFERAIAKANTLEECWTILQSTAKNCGFRCERLRVGNTSVFESCLDSRATAIPDPPSEWRLRIPMLDGGYVDLTRPFDTAISASVVGPFVDAIRGTLAPVLRRLEMQRLEASAADSAAHTSVAADLEALSKSL
jgi:hypothetical protein